MISFSERSGYIKPSGAIIVECMPKEVRIYRRIMKLSLCLYFITFINYLNGKFVLNK